MNAQEVIDIIESRVHRCRKQTVDGGNWHTVDRADLYRTVHFTGLYDHTEVLWGEGLEIYEGDILERTVGELKINTPVVWDQAGGTWSVYDDNRGWLRRLSSVCGSYTVIGNVYDNPELLA